MKTLETWLSEYSADHKNHTNQKIHLICVPLIFFTVVGFLLLIPVEVFGLPIGYLFAAVALLWYATLGLKALLIMLAQLSTSIGLVIWLQHLFSSALIWILAAVFALAWVGQFWGHKLEGRKPSFFTDLQYLLIGPLWVWLGKHR